MQYIFIVNPHAGESDNAAVIRNAVNALPEKEQCEVYVTKAPGDATVFVSDWCASHPGEPVRFIACGGDGTINEVFAGAAERPKLRKELRVFASPMLIRPASFIRTGPLFSTL